MALKVLQAGNAVSDAFPALVALGADPTLPELENVG